MNLHNEIVLLRKKIKELEEKILALEPRKKFVAKDKES